jgi:hypothetical protein
MDTDSREDRDVLAGFEVLAAVGYEEFFYLLGYNAMQSVESQSTFRRNVSFCLLPASR